MEKLNNLRDLRGRRKELRKKQTPQENILWAHVRGKKLGSKFYRQYSIGYYIVDFYCPTTKLIIELDGSPHAEADQVEYDKIRNTFFEQLGYKVLRFWNWEVDRELERVLGEIKEILSSPPR